MRSKHFWMSLCLLWAVLLAFPHASEAQFTFTTNNGAITITGYTGTSDALTIPDTINGLPVTSIGDEAFQFGNFSSISIPTNVTSLGAESFSFCSALTNMMVSSAVTNIGDGAFGLCILLQAINVDPGNQFYTSVNGVLFDRGQITLIQYPPGLWDGNYTIPEGVTTIAENAFFSCIGLTNLVVSSTVTNIGDGAFEDCFLLQAINVAPDNQFYASVNGVLFDKFQTTLIQFPPGSEDGNYNIPDGVTTIAGNAFYSCFGLTNVLISGTVTNIVMDDTNAGGFGFLLAGAFQNSGLTSISVDPDNLFFSSVDGVVFDHSQKTLLIYPPNLGGFYAIPIGVAAVGNYAFCQAYGLTNIVMPNTVTTIGAGAFELCRNLASVTIPDSVTNIGESAFLTCASLTNAIIGQEVSNIGNTAFADCSSLSNVILKGDLYSIGMASFVNCPNLTGVYFLENAPVLDGFSLFPFAGDPNIMIYYLPGTSGWASKIFDVPALPWYPFLQPGGNSGAPPNQFGFTINWAAGQTVEVDACTNLAKPVWTPLQTLTLTNGSTWFGDSQRTSFPARYYRVSSL